MRTAPIIIIQARMASTRLPGKVLMDLNGVPVIEIMINRLERLFSKSVIVVATSVEASDDPLFDFVESMGVRCFRGSEKDVLSRFAECNAYLNARTIVRATADCPFVDVQIIQRLLDAFLENKSDYAYLSPKFAEGLDVEIMSNSALALAHKSAKLTSEREHVTLYLAKHPEKFKIFELDNPSDHSQFRFTLDTHEDYLVLNAIAKRFYQNYLDIKYEDIVGFLRANSDVHQINSAIVRNEGLINSLRNDQKFDQGI